jgi:L-alanine-DL-glutamate epimerase-like enolase superfamily enzyme
MKIQYSSNHSLVMVFTLHLMGAIPNAGPYAEFSIEPQTTSTAHYTSRLQAVDGKVQIPSGPGWGIEIDPAWLAQAERLCSNT